MVLCVETVYYRKSTMKIRFPGFVRRVLGLTISFTVVHAVNGLNTRRTSSGTLQHQSPKTLVNHFSIGNLVREEPQSSGIGNKTINGNTERGHLEEKEAIDSDFEPEYEYDYDEFKKDYYDENKIRMPIPTARSDEDKSRTPPKQRKKPQDTNMENYCSVFLYVRIRVFSCLRYAISYDEPQLKSRCLHVLLFWFMTYLTVAIYLWCTQGWCCCCFAWMCWCCRPYAVMREAKDILAGMPPGVGTAARLKMSGLERKYYSRLEEALYY